MRPAAFAATISERLSDDNYRTCLVREARTWLDTPYHHMGRVKGGGVDCLMIILEVYEAVGLIPHFCSQGCPRHPNEKNPVIGYYRPDFMWHRDEETYLGGFLEYGTEVDEAGVGDVVLFKYGRVFGHGGIVTGWPHIIHADATREKVVKADATKGRWARRPKKFVSWFSA